jgi:Sec7-like guanine-nucleotide exchange factor
MDVYLPKETQQIDRVMEAFAQRYHECNPQLFTSSGERAIVVLSSQDGINHTENIDQPYVLAFSLIMLHTDAFNKSNKSKMTKADYIRNTRIDGVPSEILDCLFDNIVYSPFTFVEDDTDGGSNQSLLGMPPLSSAETTNSSFFNLGHSTKDRGKIDPHFLITKGLTHELKTEIELHVPSKSAHFLPFISQL